MKKILILTFALSHFIYTYGQKDSSLDDMLAYVDKSTVTSGIIYERAAAFAHLYNYNTIRDTADVFYFEQAESELYRASNQTRFISNAALRSSYAPVSQTNVVDVGILNSQYQYLNYDENDPSSGGLTLNNNLFYQVSGKPPFLSSSVLVMAPLKKEIAGTSFTYNFKSSLWFNNSTKTIKKVTAVLGDGVAREVIVNGSIVLPAVTLTYTQSGYKYLQFTVIYSDNSTQVTYGKLYAKVTAGAQAAATSRITEDFTLTASIPFKGYDETTGTLAQIEYRIFYRTNNGNTQKTLMKPVIISDGFDPGDKRKIQASDYINYVPGKDASIEDMMSYIDCSGDTAQLIDTLNARGYDVVVVNYPTYTSAATGKEIDGGADFIERNAMAMVALIQKLNTTLAANGSAEQLVLVGPSMGGQITRYALAYMEKQYAATNNVKWLHKARLWISLDSPHLGANIPEGLQALVNLLKEESTDAADFYYKQLGSPAAKQQLINWHQEGASFKTVNTTNLNGRTISQGWTTNSGSSFYKQFYNNIYKNGLAGSKGYPVNVRKIALVNGSVTGKTYGTDGEATINIGGYSTVCAPRCKDVLVAAFESYTLPPIGTDRTISRYKNSFSDRRTHAPNKDSRGNVDVLPGGWFPGYDILSESIMATQEPGVTFKEKTNKQIHCFIPSFSALGMKNPDQNWAQSLKRNLICSNEVPFDSYFGHDDNTQHTTFDCESVNWLLKEIDGAPQAPWFPITDSDLSGPSAIVVNDTKTYSFASLCAIPSAATWKVSSNLQKVSATPYAITVKGASAGTGSVTATFTNGEKVVKMINISAALASISVTPNPAQDRITVSSVNQSKGQKSAGSLLYAIKITDRMGSVRKIYQYKSGVATANITVADLNEGLYLVSVFNGQQWSSQSLIIHK